MRISQKLDNKSLLKISLTALALYVTAYLISCGPMGSSQPTKKYDNLVKSSVPAGQFQNKQQSFLPSDIYSIEPEAPLEFVAGQPGQIRIRAILNIPNAKYNLVASDLPAGAQLVAAANGEQITNLVWTPSAEMIPRGMHEIRGEFHASLQILSLPDPQSETLIKNLSTETVISYRVTIAQERPEISLVKDLPAKINEGDMVDNFTVEVKDAVSTAANPPSLEIYYRGADSNEIAQNNGTMYVALKGSPVQTSPGVWQFNLKFDAQTLVIPDFSDGKARRKNATLKVAFFLKAVSANGLSSGEHKVDTEIVYNAKLQKPAFSMSDDKIQVAQGSTLYLSFSAFLRNARGDLDVALTDSNLNWPGKPQLKCIDTANSKLTMKACELVWNVPCDAELGRVKLQVSATPIYESVKVAPKDSAAASILQKDIQVVAGTSCAVNKTNKKAEAQQTDTKPAAKKPAVAKPKKKKTTVKVDTVEIL